MSQRKRGIRIQTRIIVSAFLLLVQLLFLFFVLYHITARSTFLYFLSSVLGIVTSIYIINRRGNPSYKIAWILFILIFPIFGVSVFLLWGNGMVMPHFRKKMQRCESHYLPYLKQDPALHEDLRRFDRLHSRQADYLAAESNYPLYRHSSAEYASPGEEFFPKILAEVESAKRYIYMEFFILAEGSMWDELHAILKRKAASGVEVKIIFDDFGSIKRQHRDFITKLRAEKIEIAIFNPIGPSLNIFMNNRNHRKIMVIDGKTAITGGFNIGDEYINREIRFGYWLDSAVFIKGEAVKSFLVMFCCMWEFTTGKPIDISSRFADCPALTDSFVFPYCDDPLNGKNPAEGIYMQILNTAQEYVYIASPYLIIDSTMMNILRMTAKSGVDVRIITPHMPDKWYVHPVTQYNYMELLENGIRIYEYSPGFIHSKLFVSDDKVATVGTVNMDYRSFNFHFECGVWLCNDSTVLTIKEQFDRLFAESQEILLEDWKKRPLWQRFKQAILHIFAPFM